MHVINYIEICTQLVFSKLCTTGSGGSLDNTEKVQTAEICFYLCMVLEVIKEYIVCCVMPESIIQA